MKKISIIILIIITFMTSFLLSSCKKEEEVDPIEHVYGTYEIRGWNFKNEVPPPNDQYFRTNLNQRPTVFSDEDFVAFKEIRDMLGSEITISKGDIKLAGEDKMNLTYSQFSISGDNVSVIITPNSTLKPSTGLHFYYYRNTIDKPVKHYGNVLIIKYRESSSLEDYLELSFHYGRLSNI